MDKNYNCSIDIFRYLCAILVIMIHTSPFSDINYNLGYFFTNIVSRLAVPFFFAVSGYYYIQKLEANNEVFWIYLKRIITTYIIWNMIYFMIDFFQWGYLNMKGYLVSCFYSFIVTGSHYHFWFFPALIFSVCLTTIIYKLKINKILIPLSIVLYIIGCLGCSYYNIGINIPLLNHVYKLSQFDIIRKIIFMGFPFFICGSLVNKIQNKIRNIFSFSFYLYLILVSIILWLSEIYFVINYNLQVNIVITFGLYLLVIAVMLFLLHDPLSNYKNISIKCKYLANFTYYSHPFFILLILLFGEFIFHTDVTATVMFILITLVTCLAGLLLIKLNNRYLNLLIE